MTEEIHSRIKFSKNSWHYKMMNYLYGDKYFFHWKDTPKSINLCPYFREVIFSMIIFPFIKTWRSLPDSFRDHKNMAQAIVIWLFMSIGLHILFVGIGQSDMWYIGLAVFFGGLGFIGLGYGIYALHSKISYKLYMYKREKRKGKPYKPYKPSLLTEFMRSKHEKICPCIEFVDEKK